MKRIILTSIFIMAITLNYAQNKDMLADGRVQLTHYTAFNTDRTTWVKRIDVVKNDKDEKKEYIIRVEHSDNIEYWYFGLTNMQTRNNVVTADIKPDIIYNAYKRAYSDNLARGVFTSDRNSGIEKLDFYFHIYEKEYHYVLEWKAALEKDSDPVHVYMRERRALMPNEINLPLKEWESEEAEELMNMLVGYAATSWGFENSKDSYSYGLDFSPTGEVTFQYYVKDNMYVLREGVYEINNDTIEINFTETRGRRYNKPNPWDDPIREEFKIEIKVEPERDKLTVTQISGANIFENHGEHEKIEFKAFRLPVLL